MPPLHGAFALAQMHHVAVPVAEDLDLDVARVLDQLLDVDAAIAKCAQRFARSGFERRLQILRRSTRRMPLPPPPATAFSITGKPGMAGEIFGPWANIRCRERQAHRRLSPRAGLPSSTPSIGSIGARVR